MTDFKRVRRDNFYYVDKTQYVSVIERMANYVLFLRPRRFGKTLFLNMLATYYDINEADNFDAIFGGLEVGKNPTSERNKYLILSITFSTVRGEERSVQETFHAAIWRSINDFLSRYKELLLPEATARIEACGTSSCEAFLELKDIVRQSKRQMYVMLDEYDNFANTLVSVDETRYKEMTHDAGFVRYFYSILKDTTSQNDAAVARMFITGVSPMMLSDVTSGFNIAFNISVIRTFNEMVGFSESDVREMLSYYREATGVFRHTNDEIVDEIKNWYDNYCFSKEALDSDRMFNSDMMLYFLVHYVENGGVFPEDMIDDNVKIDFSKIEMLLRYEQNFGRKTEIIENIMINEQYPLYGSLVTQFSLDDLTDPRNVPSLLYYLGMLTYGRDKEYGDAALVVPNKVVKSLYYDYMLKSYAQTFAWQTDEIRMSSLWKNMMNSGEWEPVFEYICKQMADNSAARDFGVGGEYHIHGYVAAELSHGRGYYVHSEYPANKGYADFFLEPIKGVHHAILLELKYLKVGAKDTDIELKKAEATKQLKKYAADHNLLKKCEDERWTLHVGVIVFCGYEVKVVEEVEM